jgi:hypothetical protein
MGHHLTGIIGGKKVMQAFTQRYCLHTPIPLAQDLFLSPLRDQELDSFLPSPLTGIRNGFTYLSDQLLDILKTISVDEPIAYIETDYFGGVGQQAAVVVNGGRLLFGPQSAESGPINEALAALGAKVAPGTIDEFHAVELDRHRHTEDWLALGEEDEE